MTKRSRSVISWNAETDSALLGDLGKYRARAKGARLKYLAALGLRLEAEGFSLRNHNQCGELLAPGQLQSTTPSASKSHATQGVVADRDETPELQNLMDNLLD